MTDLPDDNRLHTIHVALLSGALVLLVLAAVWIAGQYAEASRIADEQIRREHQAWLWALATAVLLLTMFFIFALVVHVFGRRLGRPDLRKPTEYVDAWSEAGRRLELDEDEFVDGDRDGPAGRNDEDGHDRPNHKGDV